MSLLKENDPQHIDLQLPDKQKDNPLKAFYS